MRVRRATLKKTAGCLGLALSVWGCNPTTIRSGLPPADPVPYYNKRWHSSLLFGMVSVTGPYDLQKLCPDGWAEVTLGPDPFTVMATALTLFIYSPGRLTIVCAAYGAPGPPPVDGYLPPDSAGTKPAYPPAPPPPASF
jgi:hypothetical protein